MDNHTYAYNGYDFIPEKVMDNFAPVMLNKKDFKTVNHYEALWDSLCVSARLEIQHSLLPEKIIFSGPATICFFADGTKEVVKKAEDEEYDCEKAVLYCIMKHCLHSKVALYNEYGFFKRILTKRMAEGIFESLKHSPEVNDDATGHA